jgi:hypothetical protein
LNLISKGGLILSLSIGLLPWLVTSYYGLLVVSLIWGIGASLMGTAPTVYSFTDIYMNIYINIYTWI